jgi:hypothetical protein
MNQLWVNLDRNQNTHAIRTPASTVPQFPIDQEAVLVEPLLQLLNHFRKGWRLVDGILYRCEA